MNYKKYIPSVLFIILFNTISINLFAQKEDVKWSEKEGIEENANTKEIEKESSTGINNAVAKTGNILKAGEDGATEFHIADLVSNFIIGLTPLTKDNRYETIAYSFHIVGSQVQIIENGTIVMTAGSVGLNDSLSIKRIGSEIKYFKNDINIRTVSTIASYELIVVVSMITSGSKVKEVQANFRTRLSAFAFVSNITANDVNSNTGIIDVNPEGGAPPYTYQWSNEATTKYINNLDPGDYSVTITDAENNKITKLYMISYIVTAMVPNTFVKENSLIVKHQESENDFEVMVSENKILGNGYIEAAFEEINEGEPISFVFGLDSESGDYFNGKELDYSIMTLDNQMYFTVKGDVVARLGEYSSNQIIKLEITDENMLIVQLGERDIFEIELGQTTYRTKIALSKLKGGLKKWLSSYNWKPTGENETYATLTKKLDASFYNMKNYIKFKYKEKYNDNVLNYKVYDWQRNVKMEDVGVTGHKYGINYHRIPAFGQLLDGYYVLEITNDKGEVYKMRFSFEKEGTNGVIIINPIGNFDPTKKCCTVPPICKCFPQLVEPCNPCN